MHKSKLLQRIWDVVGAAPIMVKVLGIVLGVILMLGGIVNQQMRTYMTAVLQEEIEEQGLALTQSIINYLPPGPLVDNISQTRKVLSEQQIHYSNDSHNTIITYIEIADFNYVPLVSVGIPPSPEDFTPPSLQPRIQYLSQDRTSIIEAITAIGNTGYLLRMGLSTENIDFMVNTVTYQLLTITLVMVAVGFAAAFFLTSVITRPLLDLVNATNAVAAGDFTRRVPRWANDEIGDLATAFNSMTNSLEQAEAARKEQQKLREQYVSGVIIAQENERKRIARELHDSTSQSLTSLLVGLQNLKQFNDPQAMNDHLEQLRGNVATTLDEVRMISWRLRPSVLDDLGLVSALEYYMEDYQQRYNIMVDLAVNGLNQRPPQEIESAIYRIIQESLTNIARYARTNHASIIITQRDDIIRIVIEDNGIGFDPAIAQQKKSLGLHGIRERASLFGGKLTIETAPGQGTTLYIEIPLKAHSSAPGE